MPTSHGQKGGATAKTTRLPHLFAQEDATVNNRMLRGVVTVIYVTPDHTFEFDFC